MPNRILYESICGSDSLELLDFPEEVLFYRLIVKCDDYGRYDARPIYVRAMCFPLRVDTLSVETIAQWLKGLHDADLIRLYAVDGHPFLEMVTWSKHQQMRAKKSKFPDPPTIASNCAQMPTIVPVFENVNVFENVFENENMSEPSPPAPVSVPDDIPFAELPDDEPDPAVPEEPKAKRVPKPGAEAIGRLNALYREHIQPKCKVDADAEIKRLLATGFTPGELEQAVIHCRNDPWFMDNNAHRGAAWFFGSAKRIEAYVNGKKGGDSGAKQHSTNARHPDPASRRGPGEASPFGKFGGTDKPP